uniref:Uncharacterized protein n=1 Tax=Cacopsylla melanoneura TaxID=428564 RepID=A0A8D8V1Y0_9HEMI
MFCLDSDSFFFKTVTGSSLDTSLPSSRISSGCFFLTWIARRRASQKVRGGLKGHEILWDIVGPLFEQLAVGTCVACSGPTTVIPSLLIVTSSKLSSVELDANVCLIDD